jgi:hypothetical protein
VKYDIMGDIHGCAKTLRALLVKLGYELINGVYRHSEREVIFLGDFIDRGPHQKEVINIVRPMIETGMALSVMGNHEFNAIAYATYDEDKKDYLRKHNLKNDNQHKAFLSEYTNEEEYKDVICWFKTLPLWLELDGLNIVHACWEESAINKIKSKYSGMNELSYQFMKNASTEDEWEFEAVETLLKGKEIPLPNGNHFHDKDNNIRHNIRIKWWDNDSRTYKDLFMGPESARTHIPNDEVEGDHLIDYRHDQPPLFLGHYWLHGTPEMLASNIACLDYSVAKPRGKLVAYQWSGEKTICNENFVYVERLE